MRKTTHVLQNLTLCDNQQKDILNLKLKLFICIFTDVVSLLHHISNYLITITTNVLHKHHKYIS